MNGSIKTIKEILAELVNGKNILMCVVADPTGKIVEAAIPPEYSPDDPRVARNTVQFSVIMHTGVTVGRDIDAARAEADVPLLGDLDRVTLNYKTMTILLYKLKKDYGLFVRVPQDALKLDVINKIEKAKSEIEDVLK